jgi:hypothetical protein
MWQVFADGSCSAASPGKRDVGAALVPLFTKR